MARILTGIQSSGKPHLGNLMGAIIPAISLSKKSSNESFFFIADLHSLTTIKDADLRKENTKAVAAAWIAFGFDTDRNVFYRQSKVPMVCELSWYLNCFTPFPMLANAHSFKDKSERLADVNAGLFTYPVLMASDILLYDANIVPVGKDQKQHLEMTRDIANAFNNKFGETFVIPESRIDEELMTIPGTDGNKMSKSHQNIIDIFLPEKKLRKNVMSIITDSTPLEEPKNPETCNVFGIFKLVASPDQTEEMRQKYLAGNYGYGHAKQALFEVIMDNYETQRNEYARLMNDDAELERLLQIGEKKATIVASEVIDRVKTKIGF